MDKRTIELAGLKSLTEKKWSGDVDTKKQPPEGLFASGSAKEISKWLVSSHADLKSAMSALNFYINRAGEKLSDERKAELDIAKEEIRKAFSIKNESIVLLRKIAGLPPMKEEESEEEESEEEDTEEEPEEPEEPEEQEEDSDAAKDELIASVAKSAEGKTGEELKALLISLYDAGYDDGVNSVDKEKTEEAADTTQWTGQDEE